VGFLAEMLVAEGFGGFVESELIDLAFATDDGFAEAEVGVDEEFGKIAGDGIDGEGDAGGIAGDHLLDDDGHGGLLVGEISLGAVSDGAVGKEREEAILDRREDASFADAIEKSLVLAGEGGESEILESGGGADGEGLVRWKVGEGFAEFGLEGIGEGEFGEIGAEGGGCAGESGGIVDGELRETGKEVREGGDEIAEGLRAENEAGRNGEASLGETREIGTLAAGFGGLHGERIAEEEDAGHAEVL